MGSFSTNRTDIQILEAMRQIRDERQAIAIATSEIAERAGCHVNTVKNAVKRLEGDGRIRICSQKGKPTRYEIY